MEDEIFTRRLGCFIGCLFLFGAMFSLKGMILLGIARVIAYIWGLF